MLVFLLTDAQNVTVFELLLNISIYLPICTKSPHQQSQ